MKYENFKAIIYALIGVLVGVLVGWLLWARPVSAHTHNGNEWKVTYGDWSSCKPIDETCGQTVGQRERTVDKVCVKGDAEENQCKISYDCPKDDSAYTSTNRKDCPREFGHPIHGWRYADKVATPETDSYIEQDKEPCEVLEPKLCPPAEGRCPTECGIGGDVVADGLGGTKTCPINPACSGGGSAPVCGDTAPVLLPANPLVKRNGDSAIVQWTPTAGDKANVYYYEVQNPENKHAVRDVANNGYVEINLLGSKDWTFGVQQSQGCAGDGIVWIKDGGSNRVVLFVP